MKVKLISAVLAVVIGIVLCGSVWLLLSKHKSRDFNNKALTDMPNTLHLSDTLDSNQANKMLTPAERKIQGLKDHFMSVYGEEQLATPRVQKWLALLDSPETHEHLENNSNYREWSEFLNSKGIPINWDETFNKMFRNHSPTGEPKDYESEMRLKVAKLFIDAAPAYLTDPKAATLQRINVLVELIEKDKAGTAWFVGHFGQDWDAALQVDPQGVEHNAALEWMIDIQRNAASIVAQAEQARGESPESQASAPSWDLSSVMEGPSTSHSETEGASTSDTSTSVPMTYAEIEAEIETSLTPQLPDITTDQRLDTPGDLQSTIEASLKSQFSSERFERAMSTLDKHGPEEGLRRLRENDPEVAGQIEQHRNRSRSEDFNKSEEEDSQ